VLYFRLLRKSQIQAVDRDYEKAELPDTPSAASTTSVEAAELEGGGAVRELGVAPNDFVDEMPGSAHEIFEMEGSTVKFDAPPEHPVARSDDPDSGVSRTSVDSSSDTSPSDVDVSPQDTSPPGSNASPADQEISPAQTTHSSALDSKDGKT
jgi:hypothetical protein